MFDYQKICQNLFKDLSPRTKNVLERRFGLAGQKRETLESIGKSHGITRERVRQIQEDGFKKIREKETKILGLVYKDFSEKLKKFGDLKKENLLLEDLGGQNSKNQVFFLLTLGDKFERFLETERYHTFWTSNLNSFDLAKEVIDCFLEKLQRTKQLFKLQDFTPPQKINPPALKSFLEISKEIMINPEGLYGLRDWPEINPKNVQDKAYIVFKKEKTPLHFTKVATLVSQLPSPSPQKVFHRTVHNSLIKDPRFVLVGRGLYALREWGYTPGVIKELIFKILKESKKPLTKEKIIEKVLEQRIVKSNTILLNLQDKKCFLRDFKGRYKIKEA